MRAFSRFIPRAVKYSDWLSDAFYFLTEISPFSLKMPTEPVSPEPLLWRDIRGSKTGLARKFNASDADGRFFFSRQAFSPDY